MEALVTRLVRGQSSGILTSALGRAQASIGLGGWIKLLPTGYPRQYSIQYVKEPELATFALSRLRGSHPVCKPVWCAHR